MADFTTLAAAVSGSVLTPDQPGYEDEIRGFNLAVAHTPEVVIAAADASDVAAAIAFAQEHGLTVGVQSTGHGETAITSGLMVSTRHLDGIEIDPITAVATVGAGVKWESVIEAAAAHGLFPIAGASGKVGVVGYLLGGGHGPLVRSHGISSDYLVGATVVTGAGAIVTASADENPDLFWALRGGKTNAGIVTELQVRLVELTEFYAGSLIFAEEHMEPVLRGWIDWTATAPAPVSTSAALFNFPDIDFIPPPLRGRRLLMLRVAYPGPEETGAALAEPLRSLAPVYLDDLTFRPTTEVARIHNDPTEPGPAAVTGVTLAGADQDLASALLAMYGPGSDGPFITGELRHLGGAAGTDVPGGSAVTARSAQFIASTVAQDPDSHAADVDAGMARFHRELAPWAASEAVPNFIGRSPLPDPFAQAWAPAVWTRLQSIRAKYDPAARIGPPSR